MTTQALTRATVADKIQKLTRGLLNQMIVDVNDLYEPQAILKLARAMYTNYNAKDIVALEKWLKIEESLAIAQQMLEETE